MPRDKILKTALRLLGKAASPHKRKLIAQATGVGQVIVVWWGMFAVTLEAVHARYVVEQKCGGPFTNSWAAAGQVWKRTKEALGNGWSVVKSASGKLWSW